MWGLSHPFSLWQPVLNKQDGDENGASRGVARVTAGRECGALVPLDGEHVVAELGAEDKLLVGDLGLGRLRSVDDELVVLHA